MAIVSRYTDIVIGAGPAGLAAGAMLRARGRRPLIIERTDTVGSSWLSRYDCLSLNTVRWLSALPGLAIPRSFGRWVRAADYAAYLRQYAERHQLEFRFNTTALRIERADGGWTVVTADGTLWGSTVIIAAGYDQSPRIPAWPGTDHSQIRLIHASSYRNAQLFTGQKVLVVGGGNSAADIAVDLAHGGASKVWLSVRSSPQIVPRTFFGVPLQAVAVATRRMPAAVGDGVVRFLQRRAFGDLAAYGLLPPTESVSSQFRRTDVVPIINVALVSAVRRHEVEVVAALEQIAGSDVSLRGGSRLKPDAIIAATGYRRALEGMVGHLGVLDSAGRPLATAFARSRGLYFIGYTNPLSGNLRELGIDARRIAAAVVARKPQSMTAITPSPAGH
jgi:cation diffusion facilitator CzcD-associated flavoprotein CzcO